VELIRDRAFYTCPLPRDDADKCRFFKWEDELILSGHIVPPASPSTSRLLPSSSRPPPSTGQVLGRPPQATFGKPGVPGPSVKSPAPGTGAVGGDDTEDIDWNQVDADELEKEAILASPSTQRTDNSESFSSAKSTPAQAVFSDKLRASVGEGQRKKRKQDEESEQGVTPKRQVVGSGNPFLNTPGTESGLHPSVSTTLESLESISEHIKRQDRLLHASEQMKQGLRKTIAGLQEKNGELERKNKELEEKIKRLESR
ncbi:hypothetical protein TREMEDRAFT_29287, partial [Tremella mesenterica DSM 1558]|uniref:uncharacterized protein n=1 Tax=Tremella mesenterica (strain ATCC 24925 / CBS 8224 / DSM 1558 / NBRC 9311 / NRRL Y-6157 / RJB 2259-6 / UBC 559-6) TaxID=578456 RepID=UPI0003F49337